MYCGRCPLHYHVCTSLHTHPLHTLPSLPLTTTAHTLHCPPTCTYVSTPDMIMSFQALPPSLRSAWRYLAGHLYSEDIAIQDKYPQQHDNINCIAEFHRRAAQPFDTKCAICRSAMAPEEGYCQPFGDFDICPFLARRRENRIAIAPGWDTPFRHPFGYTVWTRATEGTLARAPNRHGHRAP